jgi:hypothetical protein
MADSTEDYIASRVREIDELLAKADAKKRLVNDACADAGLPPRYTDIGGYTSAPVMTALTRDRFYGRPMATAIREYLEMRGPSDRGGRGAASVNEIHAALVEGGFVFDTKNDLNAKRGLRDALTKNTGAFHRVGDSYGLAEWYQKPRPPKLAKKPAKRPAKKKAAAKPKAPAKKASPAAARAATTEPATPAPAKRDETLPKLKLIGAEKDEQAA